MIPSSPSSMGNREIGGDIPLLYREQRIWGGGGGGGGREGGGGRGRRGCKGTRLYIITVHTIIQN